MILSLFIYYFDEKLSKYPCTRIIGVPLSPLPLVKSHNEPSKSVICLGVVPKVWFVPFKSAALLLIFSRIASFKASPFRSLNSLSAKYLIFNSFGVPFRPSVWNGETTFWDRKQKIYAE